MTARKRVVVLISGSGTNMMALIEASRAADYPAEIVGVISNRPQAGGLAKAHAAGIATEVLDHKLFADRAAFDNALGDRVSALRPDVVVLAGFMRLFTPAFVEAWAGRLINIHPALLPAFPGLDTHERALAAGVRLHGCTVHYVTAEMDAGPIIGQAAIPVLAGDTPESLRRRVLRAEHALYPAMLARVARGDAPIVDGLVPHGEGDALGLDPHYS